MSSANAQPPSSTNSSRTFLRPVTVENLVPYSFDEPVQLDLVKQELIKIGIAAPSDDLRLDDLPGNPNRHDFLFRKTFRVLRQDKVLCLLTVGKDLGRQWKRAVDFAKACPAISCRPLCCFQVGNRDYAAIEYFDGCDLETLIREQRVTTSEARGYMNSVVAGLEQTLVPSTPDAVAHEINQFLARVCELPLFTGFDQAFLTQIAFPFVRSGARSVLPCKRWTNGDLIPRNILINEKKAVRLIDYEFAGCTHFFAEDAWRWRTFSSLPAELLNLTESVKTNKDELWFEAYCLFRQLVLAHETNGAHMAVGDSQPTLVRLREIITAANDGFRTSVFLRPLGLALEFNELKLNSLRQTRENSRLAGLLQKREAQLLRIENSLLGRTVAGMGWLRNKIHLSKSPKFHFHLDSPRAWRPTGELLDVHGWCFAKSSIQLVEIRVQIDQRVYNGVYGEERADVGLSHPEHPQAYRSGFKVEVQLQLGDQMLDISVCDEKGRWHVVYHTDLRKDPETIKGNYAHWIKEFDTLTVERIAAIKAESADLPNQPLISIILPVFNTPEEFLIKAIESVRAQTYDRWELCIADDASTLPHVSPLLGRYANQDKRIKITFRSTNGHIAAASNTALSMASGEYVALLDHDDELRPHALTEVVKAINNHPDLELIYSDEDKLDGAGNRSTPYFKPDWMPDLLIGHNYLCHFSVCRAATLRKIGGWRSGFDGAQDWDLQFRITEQAAASQIVHIPKILYHWRAIPGSTALATGEKNYVVEAARRAIAEHFERTNEKVELVHLPGNHWRAKYPLPKPAPLVSLLIPTKNGLNFLRRCLDSILQKTTYPSYEILIIDNGSDDAATLKYLQQVSNSGTKASASSGSCSIRVVTYPHPFNFSALNNFGMREARGEFVGLLNDDLEVITPDWLEEMVSHAARPGIGCVGAKLYYPNNTLQHAGVVLGIGGVAGHAFKGFSGKACGSMNRANLTQNYSSVTGACLIVRKSTYEAVGGLDETNLTISLNDIDFCLKVRAAGYRNVWTPFAELYHHESATRGYEDTPEKMARFETERAIMKQRWGAILEQDPAYNPNLTLNTEDFALAYPPRTLAPTSKR